MLMTSAIGCVEDSCFGRFASGVGKVFGVHSRDFAEFGTFLFAFALTCKRVRCSELAREAAFLAAALETRSDSPLNSEVKIADATRPEFTVVITQSARELRSSIPKSTEKIRWVLINLESCSSLVIGINRFDSCCCCFTNLEVSVIWERWVNPGTNAASQTIAATTSVTPPRPTGNSMSKKIWGPGQNEPY